MPVAIFSSATFDATSIDPLSVSLAGAAVRLRGRGTPQVSFEDIDGDGLLDLVVHVETEALEPQPAESLSPRWSTSRTLGRSLILPRRKNWRYRQQEPGFALSPGRPSLTPVKQSEWGADARILSRRSPGASQSRSSPPKPGISLRSPLSAAEPPPKRQKRAFYKAATLKSYPQILLRRRGIDAAGAFAHYPL